MFIRQKKRGERIYLQIVENERVGPKVVQHVRATLGRLDILQETGKLDSLLRSGLRFSQKLLVLDAHKNGECTNTETKKIGAVLLFEKLWRETGIQSILATFLSNRKFEFAMERLLFIVVLSRLIS